MYPINHEWFSVNRLGSLYCTSKYKHSFFSCSTLTVFLISPFNLHNITFIPRVVVIRYLKALRPFGFILPPSSAFTACKALSSTASIVISRLGFPALLNNMQPSPSINPASHWLNLLVVSVWGFSRVVSEVPTELSFVSSFFILFIRRTNCCTN
jgi:hypothetical protein